MRTPLEKAHDVSSIGTFILTIVLVAFVVIPMLWPSHASQSAVVSGGKPMIGWVMPSILAFCLLLAGVLNLLAARTRREPSPARPEALQRTSMPMLSPSPPILPAHVSTLEERIFVGVDITPQFLSSLHSGHTEVQAGKLLELYVGKWIKLSGAVNHVGKFEYGSSTVMFSTQSFDGVRVLMSFGAAWTERLSVLRLGNNINVIGRITAVDGLMVKLRECELV
jgi:tRNA_anti-like